jgi:hypothetical protein
MHDSDWNRRVEGREHGQTTEMVLMCVNYIVLAYPQNLPQPTDILSGVHDTTDIS